MNYFKILRFIQKGDLDHYDVPMEMQQAFLNHLGNPKGNIDRGYFQYLCQNVFVRPKYKIYVLNIVSALIIPFITCYYVLKGVLVKKGVAIDTMIENKGMNEVVPEVVNSKYHPDSSYWYDGVSFTLNDIIFLLELAFHAPFHPYFVLKSMMNIAHYSDMFHKHSPKTMIQFGEFSFSSSILTEYCHRHGAKHIDIMHGEKIFFIRDAYFCYDECYVWSEHHKKLFISMNAEPTQFRVALPPSLKIDINANVDSSLFADYKYYLAIYNEQQIKSIVDSMQVLKNEGKKVLYRPHPRYSNMELLHKYVSEEEIEYPNKVSIVKSLSNVAFAVGAKSTVLTQAYFSGIKVVIDNITYSHYYNKLKERNSILASIDCILLSDYMNAN